MGHRCTYAIREGGAVLVYYSNWGALSVPQDVFWGPAFAERFIREHEERGEEGWVDTVFGEGGVALDKDTRTLALFGGDGTLEQEPVLGVFQQLMRVLWGREGWTVRWVDDMADVAEQVGVDRSRVYRPPLPARPELISPKAESCFYRAVVSANEGDEWIDRVAGEDPDALLTLGPKVLELLAPLPDLGQARAMHLARPLRKWEKERPGFLSGIRGGFAFDLGAKTLDVGQVCLTRDDEEYLRGRWAGWTLRFHGHGLAPLWSALGRDLPADLRPDWVREDPPGLLADLDKDQQGRVLEVIQAVLLREDRRDFRAWMEKIQEEHLGADGWINPRALENPKQGRPDEDLAEGLFSYALSCVIGGGTLE
jgi:hypothetical protein